MELEEALHRYVAAQAPIVSLIGETNRIRFYKLKVPQGSKFPAIVQQRSGTARRSSYCGPAGTIAVSLQLDFYAKTWAEMAATAKAFRKSFDPDNVQFPIWMGAAPTDSPPLLGVRVKVATLETDFDLDDPEPGLERRTQLWTFWVVEDEPPIQG